MAAVIIAENVISREDFADLFFDFGEMNRMTKKEVVFLDQKLKEQEEQASIENAEKAEAARMAQIYLEKADATNWLDTETRRKYLDISNQYYERSL